SNGTQAVINAQNNAVAGISTQTEQSKKEIDQVLQRGKSTVANKLSSTITALDATKNPWVPVVVWSIAKTSIMIPFTLIIAALTLMTTLTPIAQARIGQVKLGSVVTILNIIVVFAMASTLWRLRYEPKN